MKQIYQEYLFEKNILVADSESVEEHALETLFSIAALFNIRIVSGEKLVHKDMIPFISKQLGTDVPEPFYKGFPKSVRALSADKLLSDQLFHYVKTYGLNMFDVAGHSVFEELLEKTAFQEVAAVKEFSIVSVEEAEKLTAEIVGNLLRSSRPLNDKQYAFLLTYINDYEFEIQYCASKNTAIRLLADSRNLECAKFISMSDVIKLVDEINYRSYQNENVKKLNLRNQDRKFVARVINLLFDSGRCDIQTCYEKKAIWNGLLHHIHYQPQNEVACSFVDCMRGKENLSVFSQFEKALEEQDIKKAVLTLKQGKSAAAVLRNLNYLVSRCSLREEVEYVLSNIESENVIVLLQLLLQYKTDSANENLRYFKFTLHNQLKVHRETEEEYKKRKSIISEEYAKMICDRIEACLKKTLKGQLGKVYIDPSMKKIALPLQENTSQGGLGVLAKGSRLPIEAGKKVRAFTYWEKVDDIDLSVIGLDREGNQEEFSWRTMYVNQSEAITYSGDQTSGFYGGSEYFDVDVEKFKKMFPHIEVLIFCDNVYFGASFCDCFCKAGYMTRDINDSGEIFEPKTVQSSYRINCDSAFAYLFGIDLVQNEFVWLNSARQGDTKIAGTTSLSFLRKYFEVTSIINMYTFFEMMATELVDVPEEADVIVSDRNEDVCENAEVIRSCDFDKVLALMNK